MLDLLILLSDFKMLLDWTHSNVFICEYLTSDNDEIRKIVAPSNIESSLVNNFTPNLVIQRSIWQVTNLCIEFWILRFYWSQISNLTIITNTVFMRYFYVSEFRSKHKNADHCGQCTLKFRYSFPKLSPTKHGQEKFPSRLPKILPCGHIVCNVCLEKGTLYIK